MEGELSFEHMQQEQTRERIAQFKEQGLAPMDAARLAELMHAQEHTALSQKEEAERTALMEKFKPQE
ncbi:hypothetical protein BK004_04220 [bacterium CG10_46_32]|nr:MAG: hypothetical protein BK004_04220 [bacterium CG10_46_32]PIR55823.1 MAG: hypothetical protein COU73_04260 [Parcubacteria group bacterium CG10_big_fil_rev_8_21_14_0_10_46_32]